MSKLNQSSSQHHITHLRQDYSAIGDPTWSAKDFLEKNLEVSRNLFTPESLIARCPRPKELEVFALLSGLPFPLNFSARLVAIQKQISAILDERLHYWVSPSNLGVEYCVFKWPLESWNEEWLSIIRDKLETIHQPSFRFSIKGVQINPDGCVVARGFDEDGVLFRIREQLKAGIPFLPPKQSGWAHVPLGRILEPLGVERFAKLAQLINKLSDLPIVSTTINSMKLIHETRWYMEEKATLAEYFLANTSKGNRT